MLPSPCLPSWHGRLSRPHQKLFRSPFADPQHRCNLRVAPLCLHGKEEREPLLLRQCPDHASDLGESFPAGKLIEGARRIVDRIGHVAEWQEAAEPLPSRLIEAAFGNDPVEPGRERRLARLPGIWAPPQLDEDLLGDIIGVGFAA
jgi:hypothetical protein